MIAVGRKPRTDNIGLEKTRIRPDRGFIKVSEWLETDESGVYAIGDIVLGTPQLAHVGAMEGIVAITKIANKEGKPMDARKIPNATYRHPEIGSVGLTEMKAKELGYDVKVGKFPSRQIRGRRSSASMRASSRSSRMRSMERFWAYISSGHRRRS